MYSVYLEVIVLTVIWRRGSSKQRLRSGDVGINLNHGTLALNTYSHRSIPIYRYFCWGMKYPGMEIRSLNNNRWHSVMKVFMAEQSKVPRSCSWRLQALSITKVSLNLSQEWFRRAECFWCHFHPFLSVILWGICLFKGKPATSVSEKGIHILGWGWNVMSDLLFLLVHILPVYLLRQTVRLLVKIQYNQLCDSFLFSSSLLACLSASFQYSGSSPDKKFDERAGMCYEHWQRFSSLLPCSLLAYPHMSNVKPCLWRG